jgi:hypothetical protein
MARPKTLSTPTRLNLLVEAETKKKASKLAFKRRISIGRLFEQMIEAATTQQPGTEH